MSQSVEKFAVDFLTYISYITNRKSNPEIPPEKWNKIFPNQKELENIYQKELTKG